MNKIFYIGRFPPPYGGATIKNDILFKELRKFIDLEVFDTSQLKKTKISYVRLLKLILNKDIDKGIMCISNKSLIWFCRLIKIIRPKIIKNITLFIVGGTFDEIIYGKDIELFKRFKNIYVETNIMKLNLDKKGFGNVDVIPNLRNRHKLKKYDNTEFENNEKTLKVIYLGRICEEKGIDEIINAGKLLDENKIKINIDLYGPIDKNINEKLMYEIENIKCVSYKGIIKADKDDIYEILENYDVSLYPTKWINEGVPGTIIESKIASNAVICSKWKNSDGLVKDYIDGIVLKNNNPVDLYNAIKILEGDKKLLMKLKKNSFESAENYYIENYIETIIEKI